jgi:hypothetical protein
MRSPVSVTAAEEPESLRGAHCHGINYTKYHCCSEERGGAHSNKGEVQSRSHFLEPNGFRASLSISARQFFVKRSSSVPTGLTRHQAGSHNGGEVSELASLALE